MSLNTPSIARLGHDSNDGIRKMFEISISGVSFSKDYQYLSILDSLSAAEVSGLGIEAVSVPVEGLRC